MAVVLITGCSSGFGRGAAAAFASAGHCVIATMRNPAKAAGLADGFPNMTVEPLDVVDPVSRATAVARVLDRFGRIDVLINNAGMGAMGPAEELPDAIVRELFETNFFGPFALMREVIPSMVANHTGRIVNITSIGALLSSVFMSVYCATKHALDAVSMGLDIELQPFGIRVVSIAPGGFNTSIAANQVNVVGPDSRYPWAAEAIEAFEDRLVGKADITPVIDAIVSAATADVPPARTLIGTGTAELLVPVVAAGERIHQLLRERDAR